MKLMKFVLVSLCCSWTLCSCVLCGFCFCSVSCLLARCREAWKSFWHVKSSDRSTKRREAQTGSASTLRSVIISKTQNLVKAHTWKKISPLQGFVWHWEDINEEKNKWERFEPTHTHIEREFRKRENLSEYFDYTHCCYQDTSRRNKVTCLTQIQTTQEPEWKSRRRKKADEGTVATKVEAHVSLRPLYWQRWQRSPGAPLSRTRLRTSNLHWHTHTEKEYQNWERIVTRFHLGLSKHGLIQRVHNPGGLLVTNAGEEKGDREEKELLNLGLFLHLFT